MSYTEFVKEVKSLLPQAIASWYDDYDYDFAGGLAPEGSAARARALYRRA